MDTKLLIEEAKKIPSLGCGGLAIWEYLYKAAKNIKKDCAIVEIGPWLGSSTAFLSIGAGESGHDISFHCYDKWIADEIFQKRAERYHKIQFNLNENLLPYFNNYVGRFGANITPYRGDFTGVTDWCGQDIGIAIHDAGCRLDTCNHFFKTFNGSFVPGETLVLMMDYYFCQRKDKIFKTHYLMMKKNEQSFKFIERVGKSYTAAFIYTGGEINYLKEEDYETL